MNISGADTDVEQHRQEKLAVASFLTEFQSHYISPNELLITLQDLEAVFEYRDFLVVKGKLEDECFVAEERGKANIVVLPISRIRVRALKEKLENIRKQIQDCSGRTKQIHHLLNRFEVWSTKMLAQHTLIAPTSSLVLRASKVVSCCFSPLLNLPSSQHFCGLLPDVSTSGPPVTKLPSAIHEFSPTCCTLPITPNKHTWQEFARITKMALLLDKSDLGTVYKSPCCIYDLKNKNQYKECYGHQYEFQPHDLVVLWIRAQRNTQAMRHLCCLFEIQVIGEESSFVSNLGSGGRERAEYNNNDRLHRSFKATLRGNPTYSKERIVEMSPLADRLVEWAVTNQALFTHRHISYHIQTARLRNQKKRRRNGGRSSNPAKKMRLEIQSAERHLRSACRSYVLRWFARRNRKVTTVLFSKFKQALHLDIGCMEADRANASILHDEVDDQISKYLARPEINNVKAYEKDRTLARIDRKLEDPNRFDHTITLNSQIQSLLSALCEAAHHRIDAGLIIAAKTDFQRLYDRFLAQSVDLNDAVADLLCTEGMPVETIAEALSAVPSPWKHTCAHCDKPGVEGNQLRTCVNCELPYHEGCSPGSNDTPLEDIIRSYPPLLDLCRISLPSEVPMPDFRNDSDVKWTTEEILVERPAISEKAVSKLGITVIGTNECLETFDTLISGTVLDLAKLISFDRRGKQARPLALKYHGSLVLSVSEGDFSGNRAGILPCDIISGVELLEFLRPEDAFKYKDSRVFEFQSLSPAKRLELLQLRVTKMKITVMRPDKDILEASLQWYSKVRQSNKARTEAFNDPNSETSICSKLWYCGNCHDNSSIKETGALQTVEREAECCRAVVRRISMESYSFPFQSEDTEKTYNNNGNIVSLRRLDSMLTDIIEDSWLGLSQSRAFAMPPWTSSCGSRLPWVPVDVEKRPMELLCRGIGVLLDTSLAEFTGKDKNTPSIKALFRHFLFVFGSWCVEGRNDSPRTTGPSMVFTKMRAPWLRPTCVVCCGRPCANEDEMTCEKPSCISSANSFQFQMEDVGLNEVLSLSNSVSEYNERSSLVGTTLLVLPSDPLVKTVASVVGPIHHNERPVEFVIASYLPRDFETEIWRGRRRDDGDTEKQGDGIFHLLPILTRVQLTFLLERCRIRSKTSKLDLESGVEWTSLSVLNIPGVVRYSFDEIKEKLLESVAIRDAIRASIVSESSFSSTGDSGNVQYNTKVQSHSSSTALASDEGAALQNDIIESILDTGLLTTNARDSTARNMNSRDARTNKPVSGEDWPIVNSSDGKGPPFVFGLTIPQPGLLSINKLPASTFSVLSPQKDDYLLAYSDLHFKNQRERNILIELLRPKELCEPDQLQRNDDPACTKVILLERNSCGDTGYKGLGWGFELVKWKQENLIRVGRICAGSPAQRAGLSTHDIIVNAGGKKINRFDETELQTTILGARSFRFRVSVSDTDPEFRIAQVLDIISASKCELDPVTLKIYRASKQSSHKDSNKINFPEPRSASAEVRHAVCGAGGATRNQALHEVTAASESPIRCPPHQNVCETSFPAQNGDEGHSTSMSSQLPTPLPFSGLHQRNVQNSESEHWAEANADGSNASNYHRQVSAPPSPSLTDLLQLVRETYSRRPWFDCSYLYFPASNGVIFTMAEAAVFLECLRTLQPKLGIRILCPRYSTFTIAEQLNIMKSWTSSVLVRIPKLTDSLYKQILKLDYERASNPSYPEPGPPVLKEKNTRGGSPQFFFYRLPVWPLPLDRSLEKELTRQRQQQTQQHYRADHYPHHFNSHQTYTRPPPTSRTTTPTMQQEHLSNPDEPGVNFVEQRIRGGGGFSTHEVQTEVRLSSIPVEKWHGVPVYAFVNPTDFSDDKMLVGFAKPPEDTELTSLMTIEVESHYLEDLGYFEDVQLVSAPSDELFVIDMNSETEEGKRAASIVRELCATNQGPNTRYNDIGWGGSKPTNGVEAESEPTLRNKEVGRPEVESESCLGPTSRDPRIHEKSRSECATFYPRDDLDSSADRHDTLSLPSGHTGTFLPTRIPLLPSSSKLRLAHMNVLGNLPDGRCCCWIANDPTALYISIDKRVRPRPVAEASEMEYMSILRKEHVSALLSSPMLSASQTDKHYCPWGCSFEHPNQPGRSGRREALWFENTQHLDEHYGQFHSFGALTDGIAIGTSETFNRVQGGPAICQFCADLTASICARSGTFFEYVVKQGSPSYPTPSGALFSKSPSGQRLFLSISNELRNVVSRLEDGRETKSIPSVNGLLHLWDRVAYLFEVEEAGLFVHTHDELLKYFGGGKQRRPSDTLQRAMNSCDESKKTNIGCSLCTLPWEKTIAWKELVENGGGELSGPGKYFGPGCSLMNDIIRPGHSTSHNISKGCPGSLSDAKSLLLQVASKVPDSIKLSALSIQGDPLSGMRLWDQNYFDVWKVFVTQATCTRMLAQAFIVLLTSIQKDRLPSWWKGESAGWSTTQVLISNPRLSSLLLHVYVLDAAIAEFLCQALYMESEASTIATTVTPTLTQTARTVQGSTKERMETYAKLADRLGYSRYNGTHDSECCICEDGGNLLCCELCKNVQHSSCCQLPIDDTATLATWICDPCINDIERDNIGVQTTVL
eukprot:scaffold880_cov132-Cylindrotheca_fusiformis.AAC.13